MSYRVFVKLLTGTTKEIGVKSEEELKNMTFKEFRRRVGLEENGDRYRYIFAGIHLHDDNCTLGSYGIKKDSAIHAVKWLSIGDQLKVGHSFHERGSQIQANNYMSLCAAAGSLSIPEDLNRESVSEPRTLSGRLFQSLGAKCEKALPPSNFAILDEQRRDPSDVHMRERREERAYQFPAEASSVQPDADLQFLQSLLPALKRMDLRCREHTKLRIQQLVFEAEFNDSSSSDQRVRRTGSNEKLPPNM